MTSQKPSVNGTTAPLANVALFMEAVDRVVNRPRHLPGIITFHGFSGYGKTFSATYAANRHKAYYVEAGESWTKAKFCKALLIELGVEPRGTIADMVDRIIGRMVESERPLIIDEFDAVVARKYHETVREIHDKTQAPIVLIGEERLPDKLAGLSERFHNRVLDWVPALPASVDDARHLAALYCPELTFADDMLAKIVDVSAGRARRICTNLEKVREWAALGGRDAVSLADWGDRSLFKGTPPGQRVAP